MTYTDPDLAIPGQDTFDRETKEDALRARFIQEGWGQLAEAAGFDPVATESAARDAFRFAHAALAEKDAQIARLHGHLAAVRDAGVLEPGSALEGRVLCALPGNL